MRSLLLLCVVSALLAACGSPRAPDASPTTTATARATAATRPAQQTPSTGPEPTPEGAGGEPGVVAARVARVDPVGTAQTPELVAGLNGFAFDLYRTAIKADDGNLVYSPYSIAMAFSMVYAGARGETEAQIADALGFLPQDSQHPAANALERHLASLGADKAPADDREGEPFQLEDANAVWGQKGFPFEETFLETLARHYGAGVRAVDFQTDPEGARQLVNRWVADQTRERIKDIVPEGVIDEMTRLVLANAIYFKASWVYQFDKSLTQDGIFTLLDGSQVIVPMMRQDWDPVPYARGNGYEVVVLPYAGRDTEMVLIVPKQGAFEEVEARLSPQLIQDLRASAGRRRATISMPRFKYETELDLVDLLKEMGMSAPFENADFSGITRAASLEISAAIHRATVAVDEEGTEAIAATVIVAREVSAGSPTRHLTVDRPFIYAIVERETGAILFLGRVMNPAS